MANFFGFEIKRKSKEVENDNLKEISPPPEDGSIEFISAGLQQTTEFLTLDFDAESKTDREMINQYRSTASLSIVDSAIEDIINEAIVVEDQNTIIELILSETDFSDKIKKSIIEEFNYLLGLLNFHNNGDHLFRQWYVDGRTYLHKLVDEKKQDDGIKKINWLDPLKTKKVREFEEVKEDGVEIPKLKDEFFIYDPTYNIKSQTRLGNDYRTRKEVLKLSLDSVCYTTSGLVDLASSKIISFLHKAIKPANQLSMLEDSMVVYRLTRAPERRIFYIDVGKLGHSRAKAYVTDIMRNYKNKLVYDVKTGSVESSKAHLSMMEDIWLPRQEGGRGTEVSTLQAASNLGDIEDILYFRRNLFKALGIPQSRMDSDAPFSIGISGEITRDELKFSKLVDKIRRRFNIIFYDLLKTQLLLKNIITEDDWDENKDKIGFQYNRDSYITELQKNEMLRQRFELLEVVKENAGKDQYISMAWIKDNILHLTEEEMDQIEKDWKEQPEPEEDDEGGF